MGTPPVDAHHQVAEVHRVEPVDVLGRIDPKQCRAVVEAGGERVLQEVGVDPVVGVEAVDDLVDIGLGGVGRQVRAVGRDADLRTVAVLEGDVGGAGRVVPDEHGPQPGFDADLQQTGHPLGQLGLDVGGEGGAVELDGRQCRKCLSPVNTMATPSSSARAMICSSLMAPPGWTTTATPASAAASTPSANG